MFFCKFANRNLAQVDIDLLSLLLKEELEVRDEVSLPGVGTFVAEVAPASFVDKGFTINPPYRRVALRQRVTEDVSVATNLSRRNNISFSDAREELDTFISEMREVLKLRKVIVLPGLGRLRATKENNFFFVADEDLNIYPDGFGLEPVSLKSHIENEQSTGGTLDDYRKILEEEMSRIQPDQNAGVAGSGTVTVAKCDAQMPSKGRRSIVRAAVYAVAIFVLALAALAVAGRLFPDFVDKFLYTSEELSILNR